ncbi:MAG: prephenate dehydrogenase [Frankiales bacterium]|nr:prephenate dehydrogenase [Frankiales bacterium]
MSQPLSGLPTAGRLGSLVVVGTGLLGTSIALAAVAAGVEVVLDDSDAAALDGAQHITGSRRWQDGMPVADHAVICVPPSAVARAVLRAQRLQMAHTFSDVASVKSRPLLEAETLGVDMTRFIGGHPMAGRENAGPWNARVDLFRGRPWPLVPTDATGQQAFAAAVALAELCGAQPELWAAADHDAAVAAVSHLPQLVSSALAASLADVDGDFFELAGSGLRDTSRLAGSPPGMWSDICEQNASAVAPRLRLVIDRLVAVERALAAAGAASPGQSDDGVDGRQSGRAAGEGAGPAGDPAGGAVARLIGDGNQVHRRLPQKRWSRLATGVAYGYVSVFVPDQPGGFADILRALADAAVNVEDITVDHVPERPLGLVELTVVATELDRATAVLRDAGFSATGRLDDETTG